MLIRHLTPADRPQVIAIDESRPGLKPVTESFLRKHLSVRTNWQHGVILDGVLIGYSLTSRGRDRIILTRLVTHAEWEGLGAATSLLDYHSHKLTKGGRHSLFIDVPEHLCEGAAFLCRWGFHVLKAVRRPDDGFDIRMVYRGHAPPLSLENRITSRKGMT